MKRWTPPEDEAAARGFFDLLRQRKFDRITRDLDASLAGPTIQDTFAQMAAIFPPETPESVKVVGSHVFRGQGYSITSLTLEYQFPSKWLLVDFTTKRTADAMTIIGFHVRPLPDSLENTNKFTLVGKSAIHYEMLALAVCSLGFSLYVLIVCIRAKNYRLDNRGVDFRDFGRAHTLCNHGQTLLRAMDTSRAFPAGRYLVSRSPKKEHNCASVE